MQPRAWVLALVSVALLAACANVSVSDTHQDLAVAGASADSAIAVASRAEVPATASVSPSEAPGTDAHAESACTTIAPSFFGGSSDGVTVVGAFDATSVQMAAWHLAHLQGASINVADMYLNEPTDAEHVLCYFDRPAPSQTKQRNWLITRVVVDVDPQGRSKEMVRGPSTGNPILDPATVNTPVVECFVSPKDQCDHLVQTALEGDSTPYIGVEVDRYIAPCVEARLCQLWATGYGATHAVSAIAPGLSRKWVCNDVPETPTTCRQATKDEIGPLPTLTIQLQGAERQDVYLRNGGGMSWTAADGQHQTLMSGSWTLASPDTPCDGCLGRTPTWTGPQRPGWCSASFTVQPGDLVTVRLQVHAHGPCSMQLVPPAPA